MHLNINENCQSSLYNLVATTAGISGSLAMHGYGIHIHKLVACFVDALQRNQLIERFSWAFPDLPLLACIVTALLLSITSVAREHS